MASTNLSSRSNMSSILDKSGQNLQKIDPLTDCRPTTLILDRNSISRLENLDSLSRELQQLSVSSNCVHRMAGLSKLVNLRVLNLPHNSITDINCLRDLRCLVWLNISDNKIKLMRNLDTNTELKHLDLSDNEITHLDNISHLTKLQTVLLHGNKLGNLENGQIFLPKCLAILSLAENNLTDLTEISHLSNLSSLDQLSIMKNPAVAQPSHVGFDYRPYVINWCLTLQILDGKAVTHRESLKAEWLYSQGKGRHLRPGQHAALVEYLIKVCPPSSEDTKFEEDNKLSRVLSKQIEYQKQLQRDGTGVGLALHQPGPRSSYNASSRPTSSSSQHSHRTAWSPTKVQRSPVSTSNGGENISFNYDENTEPTSFSRRNYPASPSFDRVTPGKSTDSPSMATSHRTQLSDVANSYDLSGFDDSAASCDNTITEVGNVFSDARYAGASRVSSANDRAHPVVATGQSSHSESLIDRSANRHTLADAQYGVHVDQGYVAIPTFDRQVHSNDVGQPLNNMYPPSGHVQPEDLRYNYSSQDHTPSQAYEPRNPAFDLRFQYNLNQGQSTKVATPGCPGSAPYRVQSQVLGPDADSRLSSVSKFLPAYGEASVVTPTTSPQKLIAPLNTAAVGFVAASCGLPSFEPVAPCVETNAAATTIQAAWKGFAARNLNRKIARFLHRLQATRLNHLVAYLYTSLKDRDVIISDLVKAVQLQQLKIDRLYDLTGHRGDESHVPPVVRAPDVRASDDGTDESHVSPVVPAGDGTDSQDRSSGCDHSRAADVPVVSDPGHADPDLNVDVAGLTVDVSDIAPEDEISDEAVSPDSADKTSLAVGDSHTVSLDTTDGCQDDGRAPAKLDTLEEVYGEGGDHGASDNDLEDHSSI